MGGYDGVPFSVGVGGRSSVRLPTTTSGVSIPRMTSVRLLARCVVTAVTGCGGKGGRPRGIRLSRSFTFLVLV